MDVDANRGGRIIWKSLVRDVPGRVVVTDPELKRILNPGPSPECIARIEKLERITRRGGW